MSLDIGYKNKNSFDDFIRNIGIDRNMFDMITNNNYNSFIQKLRVQLTNQSEDNKLTEDDVELLTRWSEEDFYDIQRQAQEMYSTFSDSNSESSVKQKEWKIDYRVLLNGNFTKLDKTQLSDVAKRSFNVHGLDDKLYDIFYDEEAGRCVPIYYDYATNNEHFFAFSVYLEKFKKMLNIPDMNPSMPLVLFDRSLMGVNTDDQLTPIMQIRVMNECRINPIFYMRECARVYDKTSGKNVRFQINIADWTFIWLYCQCINTYREQSRQTRKNILNS